MGGTGRLVDGLVGLIEGQGGRVICDTRVARIGVERCRLRRAAGQRRLAVGRRRRLNADSAFTYRHLLGAEHRRRWTDRRIERALLDEPVRLVLRHPAPVSRGRPPHDRPRAALPRLLADIFDHQRLAQDFSLYLHRPTATDPSLAPPGCDTFYALAPVPHQASGIDWTREAEPFRRAVQRRLEDHAAARIGTRSSRRAC